MTESVSKFLGFGDKEIMEMLKEEQTAITREGYLTKLNAETEVELKIA